MLNEKKFNKQNKHEQIKEFPILQKILGENFTPAKTIKLDCDVDKDNNKKELPYNAYWTELKNPKTDDVVEGKIYLPENTENVNQFLIIIPGYRGDFVLQESDYAADFAANGRALVVLRHNGLRSTGERIDNYIHCPEKTNFAAEQKQQYLGGGVIDFSEFNNEILTALMALSDKIDEIKKIDIIGHSWGGRIALNSIVGLKELTEKNVKTAKNIMDKLDNLILMGAWLERREKKIEEYREYFQQEEKAGYYNGLNAEDAIKKLISSGNQLGKIGPRDLPENLRIVGVYSLGDEEINLSGGDIDGFFEQIKGKERIGSIILKDLKELLPDKIGGRASESHDYALKQIRKWIGKIIDKSE